jgi:hypothetical protein
VRATGAAAVLLLLSLPAKAAPAPVEKPFPVDRTCKLQDDGVVYTVEGRVRIPKGVEITVFHGSTIRCKGEKPAVIEVEGGLDVVGVFETEVPIEDVVIEPCATFESIRLVTASFHGTGGLRTREGVPAEGKLRVELSDFMKPSTVDLSFRGGYVDLMTSCFDLPVKVRGVDASPTKKNTLRASVRSCNQDGYACKGHNGRLGVREGLSIENADEIVVSASRIGGEALVIKDWRSKLTFDMNKVETDLLDIRNSEAGRMAKVQFTKCDIGTKQINVFAPPAEGFKDHLTMDRCWFRGLTDAKEILRKVVRDGDDLPEANGSRVVISKPAANPLEFAGKAPK